MTTTVAPQPLFGPITLEDMRGNELLTRAVLPLVREVCAINKDRFTVEDVTDGLLSGAYSLWGVMLPPASLEAIAVTRKQGRVYEAFALGPEVSDILPFISRLAGQARASGCDRMVLVGPSFLRARLKQDGWRAAAVIYEKAL